MLSAHPAFAQTGSMTQAPQSPAAATIDTMFAKWNSDATPGCAVAVDRAGQVILSRSYGMADIEHNIRITPDTVFEAGSVSKQFTAAAVLKLVEAGKLSLDTDVRTIIPDLPDYGHVITVDQLLNHTSGLRDWSAIVALAGWPRGTRIFTQNDFLGVVIKQKALNFAPGAESSYTNTGYNLLTEIVKRVSGKTLAEYSQEVLFRPLGMTHSQWRDDFQRIVPNRAPAYGARGDRYELNMPFENAYGNGGLLTTIGDLVIWNRALTSNALGAYVTTKLSENGNLADGRKLNYARGLLDSTFHGTEEIAHSGATAGYRAWLARYPAHQLSVAMLCNAANADIGIGRKMAAQFLPNVPVKPVSKPPLDGLFIDQATGAPLIPELYQVAQSRIVSKDRVEITWPDGNLAVYLRTAPVAAASVKLADFAGHYASDEVQATYDISASADGLTWRIRDRPDYSATLKPLYRDAFQGGGATVRFVRDAGGNINGLTISVERARNVRFSRLR